MYLCQVIILVLGRLRQEGQPGLHSEVEVEVRGLGVKGQPELYSEVLSQNKISNNKKAQYTKQTQQNHM